MKNIIIDCDPGIDDTLALLLALHNSNELNIVGITIVCGNVPTDIGHKNVVRLLKKFRRSDIKVYKGADKPLKIPYVSAQDTHGLNGLGDCIDLDSYVYEDEDIPEMSAEDFIVKSINEIPDLTIVALGPLTNIALAIQKEKNFFAKINQLVCMGGTIFATGNCGEHCEYNFWCDPDSAKLVFDNSNRCDNILMFGLDVTRLIVLKPDKIQRYINSNKQVGKFIRNITDFYMQFHWEQEKILGCVINDPLVIAYLINPSICAMLDYKVNIIADSSNPKIIGKSEGKKAKVSNCKVALGVNSYKFWEIFDNITNLII